MHFLCLKSNVSSLSLLFLLLWNCLVKLAYVQNFFTFCKIFLNTKVMTLTASEREDSCQLLLSAAGAAGGSWEAAEYEAYQCGDSERGTLPLIAGSAARPASQCPTCGSERVSAYMRRGPSPTLDNIFSKGKNMIYPHYSCSYCKSCDETCLSSGCLPVSCRAGRADTVCCACEPLATPTQGCGNPACVSHLCCGLVTNTVKKTAKKLDM